MHFQYLQIKWRLSLKKRKCHIDSWVLSLTLKISAWSRGKKIHFLKSQRMNLGQSSNWIALFYHVPCIPQVTQPLAVVPVRITVLYSLLKQPWPKWMPGIRPAIVSFTFSTTAEAWRKLPPSSSPPQPPSPPPRPTHRDVRKEADQMKELRNGVSSVLFALPSISHRSTSKERGEGFLAYNWCSSATNSYLRTFSHL